MNRAKVALHFLIIATISLLVYFNHFQNEFVYDDAVTIHRNFDIKHIKKAFSNIVYFNTRPVIQISYAIDYYFSHLRPFGYHATNFIFHIFTSLLIYCMVFNLSGGGIYSLPFISALIFSLHPINTESVCYLSGRASIFLAFFFLLSINFFIHGMKLVKNISPLQRGKRGDFLSFFFFFFGSVLSFIAGWLSKKNIVTLPFILIGISYFFYSTPRSIIVFLKEKKAFLLFLGFIGLYVIFHEAKSTPTEGLKIYNSLTYFATQVNAVPLYYLRLFLFPFNLNIDPDFPSFYAAGLTKNIIAFLMALFVIFFFIHIQNKLLTGIRYNFDRNKWLSFGLFWFFFTLAPTSSFIPLNELVSEHRIYLPAVGLSIFLGALLLTAIRILRVFFLKGAKYGLISGHCLILLIILFFCFNVINRNFVWKNNESIWKDALKKSPLKARPYNEVGLVFFNQKQFNKAEKLFKQAIELNPKYSHTLINLGNLYRHQGKLQEAIMKYEKAIKLDHPSSYFANIELGNIDIKKNHLQNAKGYYEIAVSLRPDHPLAHYNLGRVFELVNEISDARFHYKEAINIDPDFFPALNNLATFYIHEGQYYKAIILLKRAIKVNKYYVEAFGNLGVAYYFIGDIDQAEIYYQMALEIDPNYNLARENLNKLNLSKKKLRNSK